MAIKICNFNSNVVPIRYDEQAEKLCVGEAPGRVDTCASLEGFFEILESNYGFYPEMKKRFYAFWSRGRDESSLKIYQWLERGYFQIEQIGQRKNQERKYYLVQESPLSEGSGLSEFYRGFSPKGTPRAVTKLKEPQKLDDALKESMRRSIENAAVMSKLKGADAIGIEYVSRLKNHQGYVRAAELGKCDLREFVINSQGLRDQGQRVVAYEQIFQALHFMHRNQFVHDDIKPENIVVCFGLEDVFEKIKVIDFDFLTRGSKLVESRGTFGYIAPEKFFSSDIPRSNEEVAKGDVWSAMCTMGYIELNSSKLLVQSFLSTQFFFAFQAHDRMRKMRPELIRGVYENIFKKKKNLFEGPVLVAVPAPLEPSVAEGSRLAPKSTTVRIVQGLIPQTWMDWVFYVSAHVNPKQRWSSEKILNLFKLGSLFENDLESFCLACRITKEDLRLICDLTLEEDGYVMHLENTEGGDSRKILVERPLASSSSGEETQEVTSSEGEGSSPFPGDS